MIPSGFDRDKSESACLDTSHIYAGVSNGFGDQPDEEDQRGAVQSINTKRLDLDERQIPVDVPHHVLRPVTWKSCQRR